MDVILPLTLSSVLTGTLGTAVMVAALNLPQLWGRKTYDALGTLGSLFTRRLDAQSRMIGAILLTFGGVVFAVFYGWIALMFYTGTFAAPEYLIFRDFPTTIDLFYPLVGLVGGFAQGMFAALILAFVVVDFHPIESQRSPFDLVQSFLVGNTVFGMVVMFFQ
ncbi:MAG: hypothetical protein EA416_09905, partial [Trueperaceae bacterium]